MRTVHWPTMDTPPDASRSLPVLHTERLILRAHTLADVPAMTAMWADPQVTRYLGSAPQSSQDTWMRYLRYAGHWSVLGFGYWAVEEKASGNFVGEAGFADYHRITEPPTELGPEIGWVLAASVHGKGYATEAATAILGWGRQQFGSQRSVRCLIEQGHTASRHVALKCGLRDHSTVVYRGKPAWILEAVGEKLTQQAR